GGPSGPRPLARPPPFRSPQPQSAGTRALALGPPQLLGGRPPAAPRSAPGGCPPTRLHDLAGVHGGPRAAAPWPLRLPRHSACTSRGLPPMYAEYFGLREPPFNITPDPRFLYLNDCYQEALAALGYGIEARKGFISL